MEIKTKYSIDDIVYIKYNNVIRSAIITGMAIDVDNSKKIDIIYSFKAIDKTFFADAKVEEDVYDNPNLK
jgi:hypothetical protein